MVIWRSFYVLSEKLRRHFLLFSNIEIIPQTLCYHDGSLVYVHWYIGPKPVFAQRPY